MILCVACREAVMTILTVREHTQRMKHSMICSHKSQFPKRMSKIISRLTVRLRSERKSFDQSYGQCAVSLFMVGNYAMTEIMPSQL